MAPGCRGIALTVAAAGGGWDSKHSISLADNNEFSLLLDLEPQRVLYSLEPYPVIREFRHAVRAHARRAVGGHGILRLYR